MKSLTAHIAFLERELGRADTELETAPLRAVLYMAALVDARRNSLIKVFAQQLVAATKPKTLALVACMRKPLTMLNVMVRTETGD